MKTISYDKLVRDKIPEIIKADGKNCTIETLTDEKIFLAMLDKKLSEEVQEYLESRDIAELADILEVVYAAADALGCDKQALERLRQDKVAKRGAFTKKLVLKTVTED